MARRKRQRQPADVPPESAASVFVTVGWTLSVMTTLVCAVVALAVWIVVREWADNEMALAFVRLLHFASIVVGCVSLVLLPAMLKIRREPPPPSLVAFAIVVAALPIIAALV